MQVVPIQQGLIMHCYYCGVSSDDVPMTREHLKAASKGGRFQSRIVPACGVCNSIKGDRTIEQMRYRLVQKMLGWPRFTREQIDWLRAQGFDLSAYDDAKLWFESVEYHESNQREIVAS